MTHPTATGLQNTNLDLKIEQLQQPFHICEIQFEVENPLNLITDRPVYFIGSDPVCSSNFTQSTAMLESGDVIQLSCTIVYGSFREGTGPTIDAVMTWSVNGEPIPAANATFKIKSSPTEVTASSTLLVNYNFDGTYECATKFSQLSRDNFDFADTNAPDYFKTCSILRETNFCRI